MDAQDLLPHRTAVIGAAVALAIGVTGGLIFKTGSQTAPQAYAEFIPGGSTDQIAQIAWPTGKLSDYVIGTDFVQAQQPYQPPVAVASYEVPEYTPATWDEPAPVAATAPKVAATDPQNRGWPSTRGDILDTRLPDDAPRAPEAPEAPVVAAAPAALAVFSH